MSMPTSEHSTMSRPSARGRMSQNPTNSVEWRLRTVTSPQNALVKELRRAFSQGTTAEDGSIAIEGLKLVEEALASHLAVRALFIAEAARERAQSLLALLDDRAQAILLPDEVFRGAVASETPQGVAALVHPPAYGIEDLFHPEGKAGSAETHTAPLILGCAGLQDPGNLGTILRSAEAFGASGVLCTEGTVSTANPKVARASAGSLFRLPCLRLSTADALATLRAHGVRVAVTSSHAASGKARSLHEIDLTQPIAIFIGSEGQGVPPALIEAANEAILIPHSPQVESLNAAIAASIVLYEAQRQRRK